MSPSSRDVSTKDLVDMLLFSSTAGRRELQSSPILGDVWLQFAENPTQTADLLITPVFGIAAGPLAREISRRVEFCADKESSPNNEHDPRIAYLQGLIAAQLSFEQLIKFVLPMTKWWKQQQKNSDHLTLREIGDCCRALRDWVRSGNEKDRTSWRQQIARTPEIIRLITLGLLIVGCARKPWGMNSNVQQGEQTVVDVINQSDSLRFWEWIILDNRDIFIERQFGESSEIKKSVVDTILPKGEPWVFQISVNRDATPALRESVPAVKGDAARQLFDVQCDKIVWAVLDSGIDGRHPAFYNADGKSRIIKSLDFGFIRDILSVNRLRKGQDMIQSRIQSILDRKNYRDKGREDAWRQIAQTNLEELFKDAGNDRPLLWQLVEPLIEVDPVLDPPESDHGSHVAGILAANSKGCRLDNSGNGMPSDGPSGLCPDIQLYDLRVLGRTDAETEFAVIAALQYIRNLNDRLGFRKIHGANLSLQLPHNVRNWACGQTPVCLECENLINSGVVVVAAAGNFGYQSLQTESGPYDGYVAHSITDPGNADGVITVGATHRYWPHTYGVSFFSSRGPTGDGRIKPDLVAPGERITSCLRVSTDGGPSWGEMDGTSMAAPHVSGAAAMLLARYTELQGRPRTVKEILCSTATDLARERSFQGHGMLDILRAFQKR